MRRGLVAALALAAGVTIAACGPGTVLAVRHTRAGTVAAVGAESQYANLISQIGGRYVSVTAIMSNPDTDPHSFEASPSVARAVSGARLIVQNGLGYDSFMNKVESSSPSPSRRLLDVQTLLRLPGSTRNPHLWYDPKIMSEVASAVARELGAIEPQHARYFSTRERRFDRSLRAVFRAIAAFNAAHAGAPIATTEPVADYLLQAAGARNMTPWNLQADIMNGVDPAPQDITLEEDLLDGHRVRAFVYNRQVSDTLTDSFKQDAVAHHVPVVGVYETMPRGYSYQTWMLAELAALRRALTSGKSTTTLG